MLNNELLLSAGGKKLDGIWEITVGKGGQQIGCNQGNWGALVRLNKDTRLVTSTGSYFEIPKEDCLIERFNTVYSSSPYSSMVFSTELRPSFSYGDDVKLYVHIRRPSGVSSYILTVLFFSSTNDQKLYVFSDSDVGKTYRMYVGPLATPPPWL